MEKLNDKYKLGVIYLKRYFFFLGCLALTGLLILIPYSFAWIYYDGDLALERVVEAQAGGKFALFGSGISQNFMKYKLALYKNIKPEICAIGSSRVMQFRGVWFNQKFLNMGGVAGNISELRYALEQMCIIGAPQAVIIGLDFWWFMPEWEQEPFKPLIFEAEAYEYDLQKLKKPWLWLLDGKLSFAELLKPLSASFSKSPRDSKYGIMAQQYSEGFGPDGSWYNTGEATGKKFPFDFQFKDTLKQIESGIKAFYHIDTGKNAPSVQHLAAFIEILKTLKEKNIQFWLFIPPLAPKVLKEMEKNKACWPHLFYLQKSLQERGYKVEDITAVEDLGSTDCEFLDGFHGGEIVYARILRLLALHNPGLRSFVNLKKVDSLINNWKGHVMSYNPLVTTDQEVDFNKLACPKKNSRAIK